MPVKKLKITAALLLLGVVFSVYIRSLVPDSMYMTDGAGPKIRSLPMVTLEKQQGGISRAANTAEGQLAYTAKLLGVIPLKTVNVSSQPARIVSVAGTPFGIKMFSDGVMVVGFSDIITKLGPRCPARAAGLKLGDVIIMLNGRKVTGNRELEKYIVENGGSAVSITFLRDGVQMTADLIPVTDADTGVYRTGMWVRDSSAGVGTMTFYDVQQGMFAGLGHGIKDTDTQKDIPLLSGEIVPVRITGYTPSANGEAGELKGVFISDFPAGRVWANSTNGVYGSIFAPPADNMMQVASPGEIAAGAATILTTIDGTKPKEYDIVIEKVSLTGSNHSKNMVIRITDPELLEETGGIVQGMSGSPIIQNGKLAGAVTHVFVNQVSRGYGVFAQNMVFSMDNARKVHSAAG
ncbi:MAG: SpoIVB peptidase [Oscillospiraceae bacterium]|nr:SpoIVB peptidase [Oscillospiraceae bacterium]